MKTMKLTMIAALLALGAGFGSLHFYLNSLGFDPIQAVYADEAKAPAASPAAAPVTVVQATSPAPEVAKALPVPPEEKITWVQSVVDFLQGIPAVGKYLAMLFSFLAILVPILTALATMLIGISKALSAAGKKVPVLATISDYVNVAVKWVAYASMYNVQKEKPAEEKKA